MTRTTDERRTCLVGRRDQDDGVPGLDCRASAKRDEPANLIAAPPNMSTTGSNAIRPFNCGQSSSSLWSHSPGKAVARAPSELVGRRRGERSWHSKCRLAVESVWCHRQSQGSRIDATAGVLVLSEVAWRLMTMSGSGASTVQRSAEEPPPAE
jgi:hypothetical protein